MCGVIGHFATDCSRYLKYVPHFTWWNSIKKDEGYFTAKGWENRCRVIGKLREQLLKQPDNEKRQRRLAQLDANDAVANAAWARSWANPEMKAKKEAEKKAKAAGKSTTTQGGNFGYGSFELLAVDDDDLDDEGVDEDGGYTDTTFIIETQKPIEIKVRKLCKKNAMPTEPIFDATAKVKLHLKNEPARKKGIGRKLRHAMYGAAAHAAQAFQVLHLMQAVQCVTYPARV